MERKKYYKYCGVTLLSLTGFAFAIHIFGKCTFNKCDEARKMSDLEAGQINTGGATTNPGLINSANLSGSSPTSTMDNNGL